MTIRTPALLLWTITAITVVLLLWAALARVDETAVAMGRIAPATPVQLASNLEGGVIAAILVHPGDRVARGQLLLRLDARTVSGDYERAATGIAALTARAARLEGESAGRMPQFPAGVAGDAERVAHAARQAELDAVLAGEAAKADGAARQLAQAESDLAARAAVRAQAAREAALMAPLVDKGIEPRIALDRARAQLGESAAAEAGAEAAVRRARAGIAEARASGQGAIARARSQAAGELAATRGELAAQAAALPGLQDRSDRAAIRSPVDGTVNRLFAATAGGSVRPGDPLVEIVPQGGALVVEASLSPADIGFVRSGQRAAIRLTAYDSSVFGSLDGTVERVSPDAIADDHGGHFEVRVRAPGGLRGPDGHMLSLTPGMAAEVHLLGRKRSVLSYLLNPVTKLGDSAFRER